MDFSINTWGAGSIPPVNTPTVIDITNYCTCYGSMTADDFVVEYSIKMGATTSDYYYSLGKTNETWADACINKSYDSSTGQLTLILTGSHSETYRYATGKVYFVVIE